MAIVVNPTRESTESEAQRAFDNMQDAFRDISLIFAENNATEKEVHDIITGMLKEIGDDQGIIFYQEDADYIAAGVYNMVCGYKESLVNGKPEMVDIIPEYDYESGEFINHDNEEEGTNTEE